jgi:ribosomal protein S6--L-glutamate ligase
MKIAIMSRNSRLYSTHRLVEAARARHHTVRVLDPLRCYMRIDPGRFDMHYKGKELQPFDAVIPRIGASITRYGTAVLRQFEMMGVFTPNRSDAVVRARDKLHCLQLLAQQGLGLPGTVFGDNPDDTSDLLAMLGKPPHVIKLVEGAQGQGVVLAEKLSGSRSVIEAFRGLYANFLVQEFIGEAKGADVRCFVVGGKVIASMRRQAKAGEFRSNLHRGGTAEATRLSAAETDSAIRAAAVMGLGIAGVDLLRSRRGPLVLEVNSSPGLEGIEAATGVDVAGEIIAYLERRVHQVEMRAERRAVQPSKQARKSAPVARSNLAKSMKSVKKAAPKRTTRT